MDKFLIELLKANLSVYLPNLGTLVYDPDKMLVILSETLEKNELLKEHILLNSTMNHQQATNMVAKYVRDIQIKLDQGESYDIFGLGKFKKESSGQIIFEGSIGQKKSNPSEVFGPSPSPSFNSSPISEQQDEETISEDKRSETIEQPTVESEEEETSQINHVSNESKSKKGILFYLMVSSFLILGIIGIIIGINYEKLKDTFNKVPISQIEKKDQKITLNPELSPEIPTENDSSYVQLADSIQPKLEDEKIDTSHSNNLADTKRIDTTLNFHLIAGSFSNKQNAEEFKTQLIESGLPSILIGPYNKKFLVSAKAFSTKAEALSEQDSIQKIAPGAWIFKEDK